MALAHFLFRSRSMAMPAQRLRSIALHFARPASTSTHSYPQTPDPPVLAQSDGNLRILTLNRPNVLNALNEQMTDLLTSHLTKWEKSPESNLIILKSTGRAFCAGGDVVALIEAVTSGIPEKEKLAVKFFQQEYALNALLAKMSTPVICFMDGITMGGGLGLSMHVPFRIATEKTRVAMPETTIGLFPDVGATFFLPRMDGELGTYLGITSTNLYGWGAFQSGIASHYVPSDSLPALQDRLISMSSNITHDRINDTINEFSADIIESINQSPNYDLINFKREAIDYCFNPSTLEEILSRLLDIKLGKIFQKEDSNLKDWANETIEKILLRSPSSCKITLMALREGKKLDIDECFDMELRLAATCCDLNVHSDFATGVNHLLIQKSKSRAPWNPSKLEDLNLSKLQSQYFSKTPSSTTHHLTPLSYLPSTTKPYKTYPYLNYSLPTEEIIKNIVIGNTKESGNLALNKNEILKILQSKWSNKVGVREKVLEVLSRKTVESSEKEGKVLKWVY